jgi:hypothetical protein
MGERMDAWMDETERLFGCNLITSAGEPVSGSVDGP